MNYPKYTDWLKLVGDIIDALDSDHVYDMQTDLTNARENIVDPDYLCPYMDEVNHAVSNAKSYAERGIERINEAIEYARDIDDKDIIYALDHAVTELESIDGALDDMDTDTPRYIAGALRESQYNFGVAVESVENDLSEYYEKVARVERTWFVKALLYVLNLVWKYAREHRRLESTMCWHLSDGERILLRNGQSVLPRSLKSIYGVI